MAELRPISNDSMDNFSVSEPLGKSRACASHMLEHRSLKRLIDFLFLSSTHVMPNERVFAESLLLRDWDGLPEYMLERLAARLASAVEAAPRLAVRLVSCGRINISEPLLAAAAINDVDLIDVAGKGREKEQIAIAKRRNLSPLVSGLLVDIGTQDVVKAVLMNSGAKISAKTLGALISKATGNVSLQSALLVRPEMSAPAAMNMFWYAPGEVREYILVTYLCDQRALSGFLHEDSAWQEHQRTLCPAHISDERLRAITKLMINDERTLAIERLAHNARLSQPIASRILNDEGGEAFLVAAKAMGASRAGVNEALMRFVNTKPCPIGSAERLEPLRSLFDRLSRDQALVALQYWGWELANKESKSHLP